MFLSIILNSNDFFPELPPNPPKPPMTEKCGTSVFPAIILCLTYELVATSDVYKRQPLVDGNKLVLSTKPFEENNSFTMAVPFSNTKLRVPKGFQNILEGLARECLRSQPENIYEFGAKYFQQLIQVRERK